MEASSTGWRTTVFRGRAAERERLGGLLDKVRAGESAALVVRGEPGIGKTALLDDVLTHASGFHTVRIAGTESEMGVPFSGLRRLCAPMLTNIDQLPVPQRIALRSVFDLSSGRVADRFLVGISTSSLLMQVARTQPLLCFVDDVQWLDAASAQILGFVARRLLAESVLMLFATRRPTENDQLGGLPELVLHGLRDDDARALLVAGTPGPLDAHVRDRIVAETRGNPSAMLELLRSMDAAELAGGFAAPVSAYVPTQLEEHFRSRFEVLPPATQRLALVAAADPTGDVTLLRRAARALGIEREMFASIDAESLVEIGVRVHLQHPLIRSAVYNGAATKDRRAVHLALAAAVDADTEPDRRAWHLALAANGPDEEVASGLERSAGRAQSRGGLAATAAFMQRSVALTEDPKRRADRALAAARALVQTGAFDEALRLLATAEIAAIDEYQRAQVDLLRAQIASADGPVTDAPDQLFKAAKRLESLDASLARETYLDAWAAAMVAGQLGTSGLLHDVSKAGLAAPRPFGSPHPSDLLLEGLSSVVEEGRVAAIPILRKAVGAFLGGETSVGSGLRWPGLASSAAAMLWDFDSMDAVLSQHCDLARSAGALARLGFTLNGEILAVAWRGDLVAADVLAAELDVLTEAIGTCNVPIGVPLLAALAGDERHGFAVIESAIELATARGAGMALQIGLWTAAVLSNGLARYEQAMSLSRQASEGSHRVLHRSLGRCRVGRGGCAQRPRGGGTRRPRATG